MTRYPLFPVGEEIKYPKLKSSVFEPIQTIRSSIKVDDNIWCRPVYDYDDWSVSDMSSEETEKFIECEMFPDIFYSTFKRNHSEALLWLCGCKSIYLYRKQMRELFKLVE